MAAYALAKYNFRGRDALFLITLATIMIPLQVIFLPVYQMVSSLGMVNTLWGMIIPPAATPTGVFLLRQYMLTLPDELIEAARIDGAGEWRIFSRIILPLCRPALAVVAIFSVIWRWNDFLWPLIVAQDESIYTLPVALARFASQHVVPFNLDPGDVGGVHRPGRDHLPAPAAADHRRASPRGPEVSPAELEPHDRQDRAHRSTRAGRSATGSSGPAWSAPCDDLRRGARADGSPWGPTGRWVLTNGPDVAPLKRGCTGGARC